MDLVSAMEMIDAITAMAEGGKSECYPLHLIDFYSSKRDNKHKTICTRYSEVLIVILFCSCSHCRGQGSTQCGICKGKQQLLVYINLTVKWCFFKIMQLLIVSDLAEISTNTEKQYLLLVVISDNTYKWFL